MSCACVERDLDAYLDRELDAVTTRSVRDHLALCAPCRGLVAEREALARLIRTAPTFTASNRLRARVLAHTARRHSLRLVLPTDQHTVKPWFLGRLLPAS